MKLTLAMALAVFCGTAAAQTPDCVQFFTFSTTAGTGILPVPGNTPTVDNRQVGCIGWTMVYESSGFSGITLTFQSADGATAPGAFGTYTGTVLTGTNPATNTVTGTTTFNGYVGWFRVAITATGSGTVRGALYGYRAGFANGGGGGGCPGTVMTPCIVAGPDAPGTAPPTQSPVLVAGLAGDSGVDTLRLDPSNHALKVELTGATSPLQNQISITAGTAEVIVPANGGTVTLINHLSFAANASANVSIVAGTTAVTPCDTGQMVLAGPYFNVTALALDFTTQPLSDTMDSLDTCLIFSASVSAGGVVLYVQN